MFVKIIISTFIIFYFLQGKCEKSKKSIRNDVYNGDRKKEAITYIPLGFGMILTSF